MFGGLWMPNLGDSSLTEADLTTLGAETMQVLVDALGACVAAGQATGTDPFSDAVALWLGLHGLAHQRAVTRAFPWPEDIADRVITALAHLSDTRADGTITSSLRRKIRSTHSAAGKTAFREAAGQGGLGRGGEKVGVRGPGNRVTSLSCSSGRRFTSESVMGSC